MYSAITTTSSGRNVTATSEQGITRVPYRDCDSADVNHQRAAHVHAEKWGWNGTWYGGDIGRYRRVWVRSVEAIKGYADSFCVDTDTNANSKVPVPAELQNKLDTLINA